MQGNLTSGEPPQGEALIYGRLKEGNYGVLIVSTDQRSPLFLYNFPIEAYRSPEEVSAPMIFVQQLVTPNEQGLEQILKKVSGKKVDKINLGEITVYDPFTFGSNLEEWYNSYLEAYERGLLATEREASEKERIRRKHGLPGDISPEEQQEFVDHMNYHIEELLRGSRSGGKN